MKRLVIAFFFATRMMAGLVATASAHDDACHFWHACQPGDPSSHLPEDTGYVCGDLGYFDYCLDPPNTNTTLVDFLPPQNRPTGALAPPPSPPPGSTPTGVIPPDTTRPRPPIQLDCAKDRASAAVRNEFLEGKNDPATLTGCLLPVTEPPYP